MKKEIFFFFDRRVTITATTATTKPSLAISKILLLSESHEALTELDWQISRTILDQLIGTLSNSEVFLKTRFLLYRLTGKRFDRRLRTLNKTLGNSIIRTSFSSRNQKTGSKVSSKLA